MSALSIVHESWKGSVREALNNFDSIYLKSKILPSTEFYPNEDKIFRVFQMPIEDIKVVVLGQDPYPNKGDAVGLSFVNGSGKIPASLRIIYQELVQEGFENPNINNWTKQGVFLLNTALTVEARNPDSHTKYWEKFTQDIIKHISKEQPCIWILWGRKAQKFKPFIIGDNNTILEAPHPAAETYSGGKGGFIGCNHFTIVNEILEKNNKQKIIW